MKEIITFHIGQAGVQSGSSLWELLCAEHNIAPSGVIVDDQLEYEFLSTLFQPVSSKKWVPRSLFVDLEPTVVDEIRIGSFRALFHPDRLISGPEDAANNFARGFFTIGKLILGKTNEQCRRLFEQSEGVQGILFLRSLGGGTGAGLTAAMFEGISEYGKTTKIEIPIYPSQSLSTSMVEPYNCLLGEHFCMEDLDIGILLDNEAMFEICSKYLSLNYPTYNTVNRMIAQVISSITVSARFLNIINCDLCVLQTNLIPYPRIHFPLCNFAPILNHERANHQELSVQELTNLVFDRENQMLKVDHFYGKFMACALFYRGKVCPHHIYLALSEIKRNKNIEFVDWCPTGFKVGINAVCPVTIPDSKFAESKQNVAMLTNTSAISQAWQRLTHRFYLLYSKRSFVHWFVGEGMEECEFSESLYNLSALVKDYEEAGENTIIPQNEALSDESITSLVKKQKDSYSSTDKAEILSPPKNTSDSSSKKTNSDSLRMKIKSTTTTTEELGSSKSNQRLSFQFISMPEKETEDSKEDHDTFQDNQSSSVFKFFSPLKEMKTNNNPNLFFENQNPLRFNGNENISRFFVNKFLPNGDRRIAIPNPKRLKNQMSSLRNRGHHFVVTHQTSCNSMHVNNTFVSKGDKIKRLKLKYKNQIKQKRKMPIEEVQNSWKIFPLAVDPTYSTSTSPEKSNDVIRCIDNDLTTGTRIDKILYKQSVFDSVGPGISVTKKYKTPNVSSNEGIFSTPNNLFTKQEMPHKLFNYTSSTKDHLESNFTKFSYRKNPFSYTFSNNNIGLSKDRCCNPYTWSSLNGNLIYSPVKTSLKETSSLYPYHKVPQVDSAINAFPTDLLKSNCLEFSSSTSVTRIPLENEGNNIQTCSSSFEKSKNPQLSFTDISSVKNAKTGSTPISFDSLVNRNQIEFEAQSSNFLRYSPNELNLSKDCTGYKTIPSVENSENHNFADGQYEVENCSMNVFPSTYRQLPTCLEKQDENLNQRIPVVMPHKPPTPLKNLFYKEYSRENSQFSSVKFDFDKGPHRVKFDLNPGFVKEKEFIDTRTKQQRFRRSLCSNKLKVTGFSNQA